MEGGVCPYSPSCSLAPPNPTLHPQALLTSRQNTFSQKSRGGGAAPLPHNTVCEKCQKGMTALLAFRYYALKQVRLEGFSPPAPHLHLHDPGPHCHPAGEQQETLPGAQLRSKGDLRKRGWRGQHDGGTGEARHTVPHSRGGDRHTRQQSLGDAEGTRGVTSAVSVISRRCPMKPEWKKLMFILCNFHCAGPRPPFHNRDRARRM